MVKEHIYWLRSYHIERGNTSYPACDFLYCVYLFGFVIRSIQINGIDKKQAEQIFPNVKMHF